MKKIVFGNRNFQQIFMIKKELLTVRTTRIIKFMWINSNSNLELSFGLLRSCLPRKGVASAPAPAPCWLSFSFQLSSCSAVCGRFS